MFSSIAILPAHAGSRAACSLLPLNQVRTIVGAPVIISVSQNPVTLHGETISSCVYSLPRSNGRGAAISIVSGPASALAKLKQMHDKSRTDVSTIKGGVFVSAGVEGTSGSTLKNDPAASQKLLAAMLQKLFL